MPRQLTLALAVAFLAASASAAPAGTVLAQSPEELRLPERMDRALREMMDSMKPVLDDVLDYMRSFEVIDDPRHYEMPEVLPNGDIIIRRSDDAPPFAPADPPEPAEPENEEALPIEPEEGIRT